MWFVSRHYQHFPFANIMRFSSDGDLSVTVKDNHNSIKWRGMFTQSLTFIESKQCYGPCFFVNDYPTDNRALLILDQIN